MHYKINIVSSDLQKSKDLIMEKTLELYDRHKNDEWFLKILEDQKHVKQ